MACYGCGRIHCICPLVGKGTWSCRLLCSFLWKLTSNLSLSFSPTPHTLSSLWPLLDQHIRELTTREGKFLRETGGKSWQDKIRNEVISGTSREWLMWNLWREYSNGLQDRRYFIDLLYLFSFAFFRRVKTDFPRHACLALLARFALAFALLKNRLFCRLQVAGQRLQ